MTGRPGTGKARARGNIETLRSGALRVRVYAGVDPVTKKRHNLVEVVEPSPKAWRKAEEVRERLLREVAEKRSPRTSATVDQLLERYLGQFAGSPNTLELYRTHVRNHISPLLGHVKVGQLDAEILDSFYGELRRCRKHCTGKRTMEHRVQGPHECTDGCVPHRCKPLAATTIRHIHFIVSGAYKRAIRWRWVSVNPAEQAEPPPAPKSNPQPPTAEQAAQIVNESWRDPDWGALIWTAMTTGARRGELCAIRISAVNLAEGREAIWLQRAVRRDLVAGWAEGDLKSHQQRRIALDPETVAVLREQIERCRARLTALGLKLPANAYLFSGSPDGSTFLTPDSVTQRYERMVARLGIETTIHKLRHFSATELIAGGVDPRTVAGRLGHGGGGTTTLKTYTAWVSEADQRAAKGLGAGMPQRPIDVDPIEQARANPRYPYEVVAAAIGDQISAGTLVAGQPAPPARDLAAIHEVSLATAKRSLVLAVEWGLLERVAPGSYAVAAGPEVAPPAEPWPSPRLLSRPIPPGPMLMRASSWTSRSGGAGTRSRGSRRSGIRTARPSCKSFSTTRSFATAVTPVPRASTRWTCGGPARLT
jgi:integrase